jgi:two-component system, NarL family, sensor histidine kinase DevS
MTAGISSGAEARPVTGRQLNRGITPFLVVAAAILVAVSVAGTAVYISVFQPWLGISLKGDPAGESVIIQSVDASGPNKGVLPGQRLIALSAGGENQPVTLNPVDLLEEPDVISAISELNEFFRKQDRLFGILSQSEIFAEVASPEGLRRTITIHAGPQRDIFDLPRVFWIQVLVGVTGFLIGTWVLSLRRGELSAFFFFLAGSGLLISAVPAAIYSSRELALPGDLFVILSGVNNAGALIFGAGMIGLFLCYPHRLVSNTLAFVPSVVLGVWIYADIVRLGESAVWTRQLPIILSLTAIAVCVGGQYWRTRNDPRGRAILRWLGWSVLIGAGAFVLTVSVPRIFDVDLSLSQGYAFLFFLVIYFGVALGVTRYRLFELEEWAFLILYYMVGILLIVLLDIALFVTISIEKIPAFSLSFVLVALGYLPLRDTLWRRLFMPEKQEREAFFSKVVDIALTPPGESQGKRWLKLLDELFSPLQSKPIASGAFAGVENEGLGLTVPAVGQMSALRLEYGNKGRKLFGPRDVKLVNELISMLEHAIESRQAYEQGVAEERIRITRDLHDNIGAQLLTALHSTAPERKDLMIRESLSDLRDIVSNSGQERRPLKEVLADLRAETSERLSMSGIAFHWCSDDMPDDLMAGAGIVHSFRSILREMVSNTISHSGATSLVMRIRLQTEQLQLVVEDNGKGIQGEVSPAGNGLGNMRKRLEKLGGDLTLEDARPGLRLTATFPLNKVLNR